MNKKEATAKIVEKLTDNGRLKRYCSNCRTDVTLLTYIAKIHYCPFCGKEIVK